MNRGVKTALLMSSATLVSCATSTNMRSVKVRPIADPAAAAYGAGDALSVARGQFMLGNVGLALEGFRKAQRYNPSDPAALEGIGDCYASMGRLDIAQSSYESALALAPHDSKLLYALADLLEHEGQAARAAETRAEARSFSQPAASAAAAAPAPVETHARVSSASVGSVTVKLPPARPAAPEPRREAQASPNTTVSASALPRPTPEMTVPVALPAARVTAKLDERPVTVIDQQIALSATPAIASTVHIPAAVLPAVLPVSLPGATAPAQLEMRPLTLAEARIEQAEPAQPAPPSSAVREPVAPTIPQVDPRAAALAEQLIKQSNAVASNTPVTLPPARPLPTPAEVPTTPDRVALAPSSGPRLERLSTGEVALVTTDKPIWKAPPMVQTAAVSTGVRWVALANAPARPNVQILNAARSQGLAASARTVLSNRGWRKIAIADAPATQHSSVVLYPQSQAALGRRLAAQFGVAARMMKRNAVVLILGRDAVDRIARPHRS